MRIEKGHVAGNELNGTTTAADLGLGRMMSAKKDFIGRVLAGRPGLVDSNRAALVGLKPVDRSKRLFAGSHFLSAGAKVALSNDQGYLTSVALSRCSVIGSVWVCSPAGRHVWENAFAPTTRCAAVRRRLRSSHQRSSIPKVRG